MMSRNGNVYILVAPITWVHSLHYASNFSLASIRKWHCVYMWECYCILFLVVVVRVLHCVYLHWASRANILLGLTLAVMNFLCAYWVLLGMEQRPVFSCTRVVVSAQVPSIFFLFWYDTKFCILCLLFWCSSLLFRYGGPVPSLCCQTWSPVPGLAPLQTTAAMGWCCRNSCLQNQVRHI